MDKRNGEGRLRFVVLLLAMAISSRAVVCTAADVYGVSLEAGHGFGIPSTNLVRVSVNRAWERNLWEGYGVALTGFWEASIGAWHGDRTIFDLGFSPVFVLKTKTPLFSSTLRPYLEAAIGAHLLSENQMYNRRFSTNYQFGDHAGAGIRFGEKLQYDLSYKLQHLSNAGIGRNNSGINFNIIRFSYYLN